MPRAEPVDDPRAEPVDDPRAEPVDGSVAAPADKPTMEPALAAAALLLNAVVSVVAMLVAAWTVEPLAIAVMLLVTAATASQALVWLHQRQQGAELAGWDLYYWCYGAGVLQFALSAGAALAAVALMPYPLPERSMAQPSIIAGVAGVALAYGALLSRVLRGGVAADIADVDPVRFTIIVEMAACIAGCAITLVALLVAWRFDLQATATTGGLLAAMTTAGVAVLFGLQTLRQLPGRRASARELRRLTESVGRAALKHGSIARVRSIAAMHTGPSAVLVTLELDFKDGVSAQHIAPVLDKLRRAVMSDVPTVADIVLAVPPVDVVR